MTDGLSVSHPALAFEWHPTKNASLSPAQVTFGSKKVVWWLGACGHEWDMRVASRAVSGQGCPVCANKRVLAGFNDLASQCPEVAAEWDEQRNGKPASEVLATAPQKYWWLGAGCGHPWLMSPVHRVKGGQNCAVCAGKQVLAGVNDLASQRPSLARLLSPVNGIDPSELFYLSSASLVWQCELGHEWSRKLAGMGRAASEAYCPVCSGRRVLAGFNDLGTTHPHVAEEWDEEGNEVGVDEVLASSRLPSAWVCKSGHRWRASPVNRTRHGHGCPGCSNKQVFPGVNDLGTTHPEVAALWSGRNTLQASEVVAGSMKKAWFDCPNGHEWFTTVAYRVEAVELSSGCPKCSQSQRGKMRATPKLGQSLQDLRPSLVAEWSSKNLPLRPADVKVFSSQVVFWEGRCGHEWPARISDRSREDGRASGCPFCSRNISRAEQTICEFLSQILPGVDVVSSDRSVLRPAELDIYIPSRKFAIEFNGLYWHSEARGKGRHYHRNKWRACRDAGVQLVQVWEDEWVRNPEQVKRMLAHKLGVSYGQERKVGGAGGG